MIVLLKMSSILVSMAIVYFVCCTILWLLVFGSLKFASLLENSIGVLLIAMSISLALLLLNISLFWTALLL